MPYIQRWYNAEKTTLLIQLAGNWTWQEMYESSLEGQKMIDSVAHSVYMIVDLRSAGNLPPGMLKNASRLIEIRHPRLQYIVVVGADSFYMRLYWILHSLSRAKLLDLPFAFATSLESAYDKIVMAQLNHKG